MKKKKQPNITLKALYALSACIFFIFLAWILIRANARKLIINPDQGPIIVQTGGIRIHNTDYKNKLQASIDGQLVDIRDDRVEGITPGVHTLELNMDGYTTWQSDITVEPNQVTNITPYLFPTDIAIEPKMELTGIDRIFFSENSDYAYFVISNSKIGSNNGIYQLSLREVSTLFNNNTKSEPIKFLNLIPEIQEAIKSKSYDIIPSPDNKKIIFSSEQTPYYIFDTSENNLNPKEQELIAIENLIGYRPEKFYWFKGSSSIIIENQNVLFELVLSNSRMVVIAYVPQTKPIYSVNGNLVIYMDSNQNKLFQYLDETKTEIILENIKLPEKISTIQVDSQIGKNLILETENEHYFLNIERSFLELIDENISPLVYFYNGSCFVYSKDENIYSYTIKDDPINKDFKTQRNLIKQNTNETDMTFFANARSSHILMFEQTENEKTIYIMDRNGDNLISLINNNRIIQGSFYMISDNKDLLVLINDSDATDNQEAQNNLYVLKLDQ